MATAVEELLQNLVTAGWAGVEAWCEDGHPESLHLDFKTKKDPVGPRLHKDDRQNYSIALSGFLNADGGLVVWGVHTKREHESYDRASSIKPIHDTLGFKNALTEITPEMVSPYQSDVTHHIIEQPGHGPAGVVVTSIPASTVAPHMATGPGLHSYYRRSGPSFRPLEHYEVSDLFGRRPHADLHVTHRLSVQLSRSSGDQRGVVAVELRIFVANLGAGVARHPAITIAPWTNWKLRRGYPTSKWIHAQPPRHWNLRFTGGADTLVYPGDEIEAVRFAFELANEAPEVPPLAVRYRVLALDHVAVDGEISISSSEIASAAASAFQANGIPVRWAEAS